MRSIIETRIFSRRADALLSDKDRAALINELAADPQAGTVMRGLSGVRKMRFAPDGRGKSGAFRVIYYWWREDRPIIALLIYGKNEKEDLTAEDRSAIRALLGRLE